MAVIARRELEESPLADLHAIASELGIEGFRRLRREELIETLLAAEGGGAAAGAEAPDENTVEVEGAEEALTPAEPEPEEAAPPDREPEPEPDREIRVGVLDVLPNGSGFMRPD